MLNENRHSNLPVFKVEGSGIDREMARIDRAIEIAGGKLDELREEVAKRIGPAEAEIFAVHKMILEDKELRREIAAIVQGDHVNAESAVSRVRPVMLAAGTTILGMMPLLQDVFWVSMAVVIGFGLLVGSVLTMVVVPVLYAIFFRVRKPAPAGDRAANDRGNEDAE